jgi:hypothetical protein
VRGAGLPLRAGIDEIALVLPVLVEGLQRPGGQGVVAVVAGIEPAGVQAQLAADDQLLEEGVGRDARRVGRLDAQGDFDGGDLAEVQIGAQAGTAVGDRIAGGLGVLSEAVRHEAVEQAVCSGRAADGRGGRHGVVRAQPAPKRIGSERSSEFSRPRRKGTATFVGLKGLR